MALWRDLRHSARLLGRTPGFSITVIVTLALGIGASTAVFTVVNALLLRPLPYREPAQLLLVTAVDRGEENTIGCLSYARYRLIADQTRVFARVAAFVGDAATVTQPGEAEQVRAARVSPSFFDVLGVKPALGRAFAASDEQGATGSVVLISDGLWRRRFGASREAIGKPIVIDARSRVVVGVLPAGFTFGLLGGEVDVWTPRIDELSLATPEHLRSGTCYLNAVGRLRRGADRAQAQAQMDVLNRRYVREFSKFPDADPRRLVLAQPLQEKLIADARPMLVTIGAAVILVLLIACTNVAGLLLVRGLARRRELAVRTALGATRSNLMGQLLSESILLAGLGGAIGLGISLLATGPLAASLQSMLPRTEEVRAGVDPRILWFALALSALTGVTAGLVPAFQISGGGLLGMLRTDDRGSIGHRRHSVMRQALVAVQIALSLVLLVGTGLLVRSLWNLQRLDPGFDAHGTLTMKLSLPPATYASAAQMVDFYERLVSNVGPLPGIEAASVASALPVNPSRMTPILADGQPVVPIAERPIVIIQTVLGPYLRTMRIPLIRGRALDGRDRADSAPVVTVNQAFARRFFGGVDPVGRHVVLGRRATAAEIVGVIGDVKNGPLTSAPAPEIDIPFAQLPWPSMNLTIRSAGDPARAASPIRAAVAAMDRDLPVTDVRSMEDVLASARSRPKTIAALLGVFSACSLALAVVGLYGLIAYSIGQRTQELGVRMALGATPRDIVGLVVRQGVVLAAIGLAAGLVASFAVTRWIAHLLFSVGTTDLVTFAVSPVLFLLLAAVASWIPARRAGRVDPCDALRA